MNGQLAALSQAAGMDDFEQLEQQAAEHAAAAAAAALERPGPVGNSRPSSRSSSAASWQGGGPDAPRHSARHPTVRVHAVIAMIRDRAKLP